MTNTLSILKKFCTLDFVERDCEKALALLTRDICWFGTSDFEDVRSIDDAREYISNEMQSLPAPYRLTVMDESFTPIGHGSGVAFLRMNMENESTKVLVRITAASRMDDGEEKLCSMHFSVADPAQQENEYFPVAKHKEAIAKTKRELVLSTMAGGLLGGYIEKDYPFYFVNEGMLDYLGYANEAEFVEDIKGLIINGIHPDDRDYVIATTNSALAEGSRYAVDYRMKKKNGSYIWVHDVGQKTVDECGREILISVCYDINQEHEKQAQLDNLMNAVPGGVALYQMVNDDFRVLYHSKGVSALSGRTPEEYEAAKREGARNLICPEDADDVIAALHRAALTDEVVSLDYRIYNVSGDFVWISGSFKRTSIENDCPIIHAVFTEMPHQRELINSLTENSSTGIIVSDNATQELLYVNPAVRKLLQLEEPDYMGKICYKYLLGLDAPCGFCKRSAEGKVEEKAQETYIPHLDKYFIAQGRVTRWAGREARVEYITDITAGKRAQEQLNDLVQNISCGVVVSKANALDGTYEIQYMNEGFCKLFEDTEEALRIRYEADLTVGVYPDDVEKVLRMTQELMGGKTHTEGTIRFILANGKKKWMRLDINALLSPDGAATTYATYNDVTEQMQQEQQLQNVVHNVPGGICLYRWDGLRLQPIVVSEQFSAMLGVNAKTHLENLESLNFTLIHPDDLPQAKPAARAALEKPGRSEYTCRFLNVKTKEYLWVFVQGTVVPQTDGTNLAYVSYTDITQERLIAQKLRASERALDAATEQAGLWYWTYDPSNNRAYFNSRCIRDFDLPQILDDYPRAWLDKGFVMPECTALYRDAVERVKSGEAQVIFEAQVRFKDGAVHWAEFRFTNLPEENGKQGIVICTANLIDEQKALFAKYELEKQKPSLGEKNLLIHAIFNLNTGATLDYEYAERLDYLEQNYATMEEAIAIVAASIVDRDKREEFLKLNDKQYSITQLRQGNIDFSMDYRRKMPGGQIIWVRNIFHLVCEPGTGDLLLFEYCYDIHEQKMAEEVLNSATTYDYERIASVNFNIGKMMNYGEQGILASQRLIDYDETRREYAKRVVMPEEMENFLWDTEPQTVIERVSRDEYYDFTTKTVKPDGTVGMIKTRFVPYDIENNIYIMTRTDVTNILKGEEEINSRLREALAVAEQANSAKTDFLSAMSHDIRTPMNAIVGMCELAMEDEKDGRQVHESLDTIRSASQLLLSLINNILDMSRIESGKMVFMNEVFSLTQQVKETAASYKVLTEQKQQDFRLDINITHDACNGDISRIHSAIDNILSNAIKYTPAGGKITYRIIELPYSKPGIGLYRFEISDTGIGISQEKRKHLFEPFYRGETELTAKIEGTGLGLSIAKAIIDLKGGTISVNSTEGEGTTFVVELPLHLVNDEDVPQKKKTDEKAREYDLSNVHILLCEDHPVNQKVVKRMLEKAHAQVSVAENGKLGYEAFAKSTPGTFDVILMDIQMPIMNGYEATKAIRESGHLQAKTIPIIALSANAFSEDVRKSLSNGMNAHLAKPIVPRVLYQSLADFVKAEEG